MDLVGRWRIETMDLWDRDAIDLVEPGIIEFDAVGTGQFGVTAVRGWAALNGDGTLDLPAGRVGQ